ncbi:hypothetical protein CUU54_04560 [Pectobacterium polaris]|uniref:hypothetical protein n=1 Tax=Pectobacterium polaris TaxID=2042057 RepID=UPI000D603DE8|nr:hypothetical protein [Pectobacterium polaris]MCU1788133.1 hypothetical protein [Pectobacterium polaris]PWD61322.1 hypothetical protein DF209_05100 [Pectobacterium polaris]
MKLTKIALLAAAVLASASAIGNDVVSLKFSDGRADINGVENVNAVLNPIGINVTTIDIPEAAKPTLKASERRALTKDEHDLLIKQFYLDQEQLLEQVKLAGRTPAVKGGGVLTEETGFGPYPKVYDMKALDEKTHKSVLEKYGRMHVNSADNGTDVDEVMTVVNGGPFRWGFTLKDGSIARFQVEKVSLNDKAVRVSYHGLGMHAGIMDAKQGLIVAFGHGPKEFTMRYKANVPHAQLLGTNPWIDFSGEMPVVLDQVK